MINTIFIIISIPLTVFGLYYFFTGLFGFFRPHKSPIKSHDPKHKFAILIAARNEEAVIGSLVHSLKEQDYPKELYDIFVIPNNCTDNTKGAAIEAGATVLNCKIPVKNKGDVLRYIFKKLKKNKDIDAYILFDADNVVDKRFISRMNDALCEGYEIAQGNRDSKNPNDTWVSGAMSISYWMLNIFYNKARINFRGSALINGTGFMVKKSIIDSEGYNTTSITEDLEYTIQSMLNGRKVMFVEDAITYDEQPLTFKQAMIQKSRWTSGEVQALKWYYIKVLKTFLKTRNPVLFDISFRLFAPIFQVVGMLMPVAVACVTLYPLNKTEFFSTLLFYIIYLAVIYIANVLFFLHNAAYYKKLKNSKVIAGAFTLPLLILTWVPIVVKCLFVTDKKWIEIKHTKNVKIHEMIKE